jgi:hypothetical protein
MARPIEATPTLRGEDAKRFVAAEKERRPFQPPKVENGKLIEEIKKKLQSREQKLL